MKLAARQRRCSFVASKTADSRRFPEHPGQSVQHGCDIICTRIEAISWGSRPNVPRLSATMESIPFDSGTAN